MAINILELAAAEARKRHCPVVSVIHVRLGPLAGVERVALESAFDNARLSSDLPNARLEIEEVPLTVDCPSCGHEQPARSVSCLECAVCGAASAQIIGGRELEITALELKS